ncbi:hypothetical protein B0H14DRAFT_2656795 [Mycena olivaceomarginata]|nr:hypothetical protein B0H14DRAFT_2656795 [Mycena olivaceomarginata]
MERSGAERSPVPLCMPSFVNITPSSPGEPSDKGILRGIQTEGGSRAPHTSSTDALQATPRYTVNVTRATGVARGTLAFGSTIAGEPGLLKDQVRLVRLQDSIRAWPDFDGQFPEPMRIQDIYGVWRAQTNPETERSYFEDLHDIKNEAQFWTLLAKARALQHLIPEFAFLDVAKVQLEQGKRDAMSWFERRWGTSR